MNYQISFPLPHQHYINLEFSAAVTDAETLLQLPSWRPGRYELGNFAKNIQQFKVYDDTGKELVFEKVTKDKWRVETQGVKQILVKYNYFASELNAGSTYLDENQLYVNPVNCCLYIPGREASSCILEIIHPADYLIAIGGVEVQQIGTDRSRMVFNDFHQLVDSPFIASATLQTRKYQCNGIDFHWWFQGECRPDWEKLHKDFSKFTQHMLDTFGKAPFSNYHFLFQILPQRFYHGVEHVSSTVIALGPGYNLMKPEVYEDLLGVSCHELYHAWNIKTIRPAEMFPYEYSRENYSRLGYVCEGVTTYYGDYLLLRSGVFNVQEYFSTFDERIQKHKDNFGRYQMSVRDSSFDTWLDGYVPGVPNRKTSIYDEGNILAFITDMFIRSHSKDQYSLDDVMRELYNEFALKNKGYTEKDYLGLVEHYSNADFSAMFSNWFASANDLTPALGAALEYIGCELVARPSGKFHEHALGIKVSDQGNQTKVTAVFPGSVADLAGIGVGDEIIAVNNMQVRPDGSGTSFSEWCAYFGTNTIELMLGKSGRIISKSLLAEPGKFYRNYQVVTKANPDKTALQRFKIWSNH